MRRLKRATIALPMVILLLGAVVPYLQRLQREGEEGYLLTAEYRIPLFLMPISPRGEIIGAGFHLFTDAGDAWYRGADAGRSMFSYGVGFHLNINTLQLRFEAARTREGAWMFEFMDKFNF